MTQEQFLRAMTNIDDTFILEAMPRLEPKPKHGAGDWIRYAAAACLCLLVIGSVLWQVVKPMPAKAFEIEDGVLLAYHGTDAEVVIPDEVTKISSSAFAAAPSPEEITSLHIGENVAEIEEDALAPLTLLDTVTVAEENEFFEVVDGVLARKDEPLLFASVEINDGQTTTDSLNQTAGTDEIVDYTVAIYADYIATAPEDLYKIADVVVVGTFGETAKTYVCEHSLPVTQVMFHVESTNKGTVPQRSIVVEYYGGTVPMSSYLDTLTAEQIAKRDLDRPDVDISNMTVTYETTKESVVVNPSDTYMLFLSYDAENDTYFVLCDAYGACKMEDGLVYSLREEKYVQAEFE